MIGRRKTRSNKGKKRGQYRTKKNQHGIKVRVNSSGKRNVSIRKVRSNKGKKRTPYGPRTVKTRRGKKFRGGNSSEPSPNTSNSNNKECNGDTDCPKAKYGIESSLGADYDSYQGKIKDTQEEINMICEEGKCACPKFTCSYNSEETGEYGGEMPGIPSVKIGDDYEITNLCHKVC